MGGQRRPSIEFLVERSKLSAELARLRRAASLSTYELAQALGMSQSKVSKIENGRVAASVADVASWARATGAGDRLDELTQRAERALTEAVTWRGAIPDGLPAKQHEVASLERAAAAVRVYDPLVVPCLLQTAEYARRIYTAHVVEGRPDVAAAIAVRVERQSILYDERKQLEFVVSESALRRRVGNPSTMRAQLDRILSVSTLPNVAVEIVPDDAEAGWWGHGFTLFEGVGEDSFVLVETLTAGLTVSHPADIATYRQALSQLRQAALRGEPARALVENLLLEPRQAILG